MKSSDLLILASRSPRRKAILRFAGIPFRATIPLGVIEKRLAGESPSKMVIRLALEKALMVARRFPQSWILGADTVVVSHGKLFGKPQKPLQAWNMLQELQGKAHTVWTGVALVNKEKNFTRIHVEKTKVFFRNLAPREIRTYIESKEPYDKAGSYDIQGTARAWVKKWEGDYFNVLGLPLRWVVAETNRLFNRSGKS